MANQASYIPAKLADFAVWLANFSALLTATPVAYGFVAGDAVAVAARNTAFQAAYLLGTNPATRTTPNVAEMNTERNLATGFVRPYAVAISLNLGITDAEKLAIGVNLPNNQPVPIPPITDIPSLITQGLLPGQATLQYRSSSDPNSKAKPFGVLACEVVQAIGAVAATDPVQCTPAARATKTPFVLDISAANSGQKVTLFARWANRSGAGGLAYVGPWSAPLVITAQ